MAKTINIRFLLILICIILSPCGTHSQVPENCRVELPAKDVLVQTARYVANTFGSAYVPYFKDVEISEAKIFQRDDYGDSYRKIRKQIGREYYEVTFTYDSTIVRFAFDFAARVRIWKDSGKPLDVIFGNGMGRNFFFKSFKKQTKRSSKKGKKAIQVPLQTEKEPESIWN